MQKKDWIPSREQDVADMAVKWKAGLEDPAKVAAFGWDPTETGQVLAKMDGFLAARSAYEADNSTPRRITKDETKEEMIDAMRDFANSAIRYNKKMTEEDKWWYGIRPADPIQTQHNRPSLRPETIVENTSNHYEHRIRAVNRASGDTSKPEDAYGVCYAWQIGGERPASGEDLPKTRFSRKTTLTVTYSETEKKETVWYSACYENSKGEKGPWSPVVEAVIG